MVVSRMFGESLKGRGMKEITKGLNQDGILNRTGKSWLRLKSRMPSPKAIKVIGQGKGRPFNGLGRCANMSEASKNSKTAAIIRNIKEVVNIIIPPRHSWITVRYQLITLSISFARTLEQPEKDIVGQLPLIVWLVGQRFSPKATCKHSYYI
jgi:hypothetical protein